MTNITLTDGLVNGIGGTIGGGIFFLVGDLVMQNGSNAYLAFFMGAIMCLLVAFCYCILSKEYPSKEGTANYPKKVFKNKTLQKTLSALIILGYTSLLCVYSLSAGRYLGSYINAFDLRKMIAASVIGVCLLLSYMPVSLFNSLQSVFVYTKLAVLLFVAAYGLITNSKNTSTEGKSSSIVNALLASLSVFVSFEGFEMNSGYSKDMEDVNTNLPTSYFLTIIVSAIVYMSLSISLNKHMGGMITKENSAASLIDLVKLYGFTSLGPMAIVVTNIIANVSANIATISSNNPMVEGYLKDLNMEKSFLNEKVTIMGNSKSVALWATCILAILFILLGPENIVKNSGSFAFLLIFTIICIMTYITIEKKESKNEDITIYSNKVNHMTCKIVSILGGLLCASGCGLLVRDLIKGE